jgi:hypothetical protein
MLRFQDAPSEISANAVTREVVENFTLTRRDEHSDAKAERDVIDERQNSQHK